MLTFSLKCGILPLTQTTAHQGCFFKLKFMVNRLTTYLKDSVEELKKVTWPTKKETTNYTLMVIGVSLVVSVFLFILDKLFSYGLSVLINRGA